MGRQNKDNSTPVRSSSSRRHNRGNGRSTIDQSRAASPGMWDHVGGGVFRHKLHTGNYIQRGLDNRWVSTGSTPIREQANISIHLAPAADKS